MSWRNHETHKEETKAVKDALIKAGYVGVKVGHGTGTAHGWLEIGLNIPRPTDCLCNPYDDLKGRTWGDGVHGDCPKCRKAWEMTYRELIRIAQEVTGRSGEYDGDIIVHLNLEDAKRVFTVLA